jgi:KDO2-lipid IV(A) lauroyltransferase
MSLFSSTTMLKKQAAARFLDIVIAIAGRIAYCCYDLLGWRFIQMTGKIVSVCVRRFFPRKRRAIESMLSRFPGLTCKYDMPVVTNKSFDNYFKRHVETFFFGRLGRKKIEKVVEVEGIEHIDAALSKGKGVILLLAHSGSFLLPLPFLGYRGYRVNQVTGRQTYGSFAAARFWDWRRREASRLPVQFIQVGTFLRPLYNALQRNEIVAIAFDGRDATTWAIVDFFGVPLRFSTGPFDLARRTGAEIIPTFMIRRDDDTHKLVLGPPFRLSDEPDKQSAVRTDTQKFGALFAEYVGKYPCHFGILLTRLLRDMEKNQGNPGPEKGTT